MFKDLRVIFICVRSRINLKSYLIVKGNEVYDLFILADLAHNSCNLLIYFKVTALKLLSGLDINDAI